MCAVSRFRQISYFRGVGGTDPRRGRLGSLLTLEQSGHLTSRHYRLCLFYFVRESKQGSFSSDGVGRNLSEISGWKYKASPYLPE